MWSHQLSSLGPYKLPVQTQGPRYSVTSHHGARAQAPASTMAVGRPTRPAAPTFAVVTSYSPNRGGARSGGGSLSSTSVIRTMPADAVSPASRSSSRAALPLLRTDVDEGQRIPSRVHSPYAGSRVRPEQPPARPIVDELHHAVQVRESQLNVARHKLAGLAQLLERTLVRASRPQRLTAVELAEVILQLEQLRTEAEHPPAPSFPSPPPPPPLSVPQTQVVEALSTASVLPCATTVTMAPRVHTPPLPHPVSEWLSCASAPPSPSSTLISQGNATQQTVIALEEAPARSAGHHYNAMVAAGGASDVSSSSIAALLSNFAALQAQYALPPELIAHVKAILEQHIPAITALHVEPAPGVASSAEVADSAPELINAAATARRQRAAATGSPSSASSTSAKERARPGSRSTSPSMRIPAAVHQALVFHVADGQLLAAQPDALPTAAHATSAPRTSLPGSTLLARSPGRSVPETVRTYHAPNASAVDAQWSVAEQHGATLPRTFEEAARHARSVMARDTIDPYSSGRDASRREGTLQPQLPTSTPWPRSEADLHSPSTSSARWKALQLRRGPSPTATIIHAAISPPKYAHDASPVSLRTPPVVLPARMQSPSLGSPALASDAWDAARNPRAPRWLTPPVAVAGGGDARLLQSMQQHVVSPMHTTVVYEVRSPRFVWMTPQAAPMAVDSAPRDAAAGWNAYPVDNSTLQTGAATQASAFHDSKPADATRVLAFCQGASTASSGQAVTLTPTSQSEAAYLGEPGIKERMLQASVPGSSNSTDGGNVQYHIDTTRSETGTLSGAEHFSAAAAPAGCAPPSTLIMLEPPRIAAAHKDVPLGQLQQQASASDAVVKQFTAPSAAVDVMHEPASGESVTPERPRSLHRPESEGSETIAAAEVLTSSSKHAKHREAAGTAASGEQGPRASLAEVPTSEPLGTRAPGHEGSSDASSELARATSAHPQTVKSLSSEVLTANTPAPAAGAVQQPREVQDLPEIGVNDAHPTVQPSDSALSLSAEPVVAVAAGAQPTGLDQSPEFNKEASAESSSHLAEAERAAISAADSEALDELAVDKSDVRVPRDMDATASSVVPAATNVELEPTLQQQSRVPAAMTSTPPAPPRAQAQDGSTQPSSPSARRLQVPAAFSAAAQPVAPAPSPRSSVPQLVQLPSPARETRASKPSVSQRPLSVAGSPTAAAPSVASTLPPVATPTLVAAEVERMPTPPSTPIPPPRIPSTGKARLAASAPNPLPASQPSSAEVHGVSLPSPPPPPSTPPPPRVHPATEKPALNSEAGASMPPSPSRRHLPPPSASPPSDSPPRAAPPPSPKPPLPSQAAVPGMPTRPPPPAHASKSQAQMDVTIGGASTPLPVAPPKAQPPAPRAQLPAPAGPPPASPQPPPAKPPPPASPRAPPPARQASGGGLLSPTAPATLQAPESPVRTTKPPLPAVSPSPPSSSTPRAAPSVTPPPPASPAGFRKPAPPPAAETGTPPLSSPSAAPAARPPPPTAVTSPHASIGPTAPPPQPQAPLRPQGPPPTSRAPPAAHAQVGGSGAGAGAVAAPSPPPPNKPRGPPPSAAPLPAEPAAAGLAPAKPPQPPTPRDGGPPATPRPPPAGSAPPHAPPPPSASPPAPVATPPPARALQPRAPAR